MDRPVWDPFESSSYWDARQSGVVYFPSNTSARTRLPWTLTGVQIKEQKNRGLDFKVMKVMALILEGSALRPITCETVEVQEDPTKWLEGPLEAGFQTVCFVTSLCLCVLGGPEHTILGQLQEGRGIPGM